MARDVTNKGLNFLSFFPPRINTVFPTLSIIENYFSDGKDS